MIEIPEKNIPTVKYGKRLRRIKSVNLFFASVFLLYASNSLAGPSGGQITGGTGAITHSNLTTTIKQNSSSLAIYWDSFDVNSNEIVNYLQPSSSSIALNRILSQSGSQIHGQINANGQVVLVNPNGILFGESATINVGGLIASGLDISPNDFMNGNYLFKSLEGSGGQVINSGLLNASLGGSVTLLGRQVENQNDISP